MAKQRALTKKEIAMFDQLQAALTTGDVKADRLQTFIESQTKRGRPRTPENERRTKLLTVRLTVQEYETLTDMAAKKGRAIAELVRAIIKA